MAVRSIVQYEVYFLSDGRWSLHSRYPGSERQEAIKDAMATEGQLGFPTKVIRESYFPEDNNSETVTIYASPKLKAGKFQNVPPLTRAPRPAGRSAAPVRVPAMAQVPFGEFIADLVTRAIIAALLSMAAAAIVTGMLSWLISRLDDFGVATNPAVVSSVLAFTTIVIFLLGFMAFFRSGARLKRFLGRMWAVSPARPAADSTVEIARQIRMSPKDLRPKHPSRTAEETEKAIAEVKRQRGDIDIAPMPEAADFTAPAAQAPVPAQPVPPPPAPAPAELSPQAQIAVEATRQSAAEQPALQAVPEQTPPQSAQPQAPASAVADAGQDDGLALERLMVTRFANERIIPLMNRAPDDPMTRRGVALLMSGAISHLVATSQLNLLAQEKLLAHGLAQCRLAQPAIDAFVNRRSDMGDRDAGWQLQDAGRAAMAVFLQGGSDDDALATAWRMWRMPLTAPRRDETLREPEVPADIYLVSELKGSTATEAMEFHNRLVRAAIDEAGGSEIKHTGKGILAKFANADGALVAAMSIADASTADVAATTAASAEPIWHAVALVPGFSAADDPVLSPRVSRVAQALLADAKASDILCDRAVIKSMSRGLPPGYYSDDSGLTAAIVRRGKPAAVNVSAA
ncbi:MAG: hypothetical protein SFV21_18850 [Rhodospirillaceae bacterium]|nr:hypothetical protein [Rhodospirillaceae bacterium]